MFTGSRPIRDKKDNQGKMIYLLTFKLQKLKEATQKGELNEKLRHTRKFLHLPWCSGDWVNETMNFQD